MELEQLLKKSCKSCKLNALFHEIKYRKGSKIFNISVVKKVADWLLSL